MVKKTAVNNTDGIYFDACNRVLDYSRAQDYNGFDKFDALNSPVIRAMTLNNKWLRGGAVQLVNKSPFNIRPLLGVQRTKSPKAMTLFARAYFNLYMYRGKNGYLDAGKWCLDWLIKNSAKGYSGLSWGNNFDWQSLNFFAPKEMPNCVVSVFAGEAFIKAFEITGNKQYLDHSLSIADFILEDLPVISENGKTKSISYVPHQESSIVLNINALTAAFLVKLWKHSGEKKYRLEAEKLLRFTVEKRTEYGAWYYTYPPGDSVIRHDNYHTGGILDAIHEYIEYTGDDEFRDVYMAGLEYYLNNLFLESGAPKWMNDQTYPHDVHGAAQGIVSFCKAAEIDGKYRKTASKIADWTLDNLFNKKEGYFYYQKKKFVKYKFTLMRWGNAWMARALSELVLCRDRSEKKGSGSNKR